MSQSTLCKMAGFSQQAKEKKISGNHIQLAVQANTQLHVYVLEYSLEAIIDMNVRVCGVLVQFGCYQHRYD